MSLGQPKPPAPVQPSSYLPAGPEPLVFEQFQGINTSALRMGVPDQQCAWLDGFFPIAPRNLRVLPGIGANIYTATGGLTIVCFAFYNIGTTPYSVVFLSDGSAVQINTSTQATTQILPASSIPNPSIVMIGTSQWSNQYLIIVTSSSPNGYWLWNGVTLFTSGTLAPLITITNVGKGYSTPPTVLTSGGHGGGVQIIAAIANGQVTGATVTNPGVGYLAGDSVTLTFSGGTSSGSGGTLTASMSHIAGGSGASVTPDMSGNLGGFYQLLGFNIVHGGSAYSPFVTGVATGGGIYGGQPPFSVLTTAGVVSGFITYGGPYYYASSSGPTITISDSGDFIVGSVTVNSVGSGYSPSAAVTATGGTSPVSQAVLAPNIANGTIASVAVVNGGQYGGSLAPTLTITDTSVTALGTATLMPFAISGTAVEVYTGHVWVANGPTVYYSAIGSFSDFGSSSAGNFTSSDSYLTNGYTQLLNANGFLWLVADSAVDYISGVTTSGSPATTTYTKQNADPQIGSPYPASVELFGHDVLMANAVGVHVVNGSNVNKISEPLDGVWNTVATPANSYNFGIQLSSSQAYVFGKKVWMTLCRIVDPISGTTQNKLFIWHNKQWFASLQDVALTFIKYQKINSVITSYGTDGTHLFPLFTTPSTAFQKVAQSRLWDAPGGYLFTKGVTRLWGVGYYTSTLSPNLLVGVDAVDQTAGASSQTYTLAGALAPGYYVFPPEAIGQAGQMTGLTIKTNAADMSIVSVMIDEQIEGYRG